MPPSGQATATSDSTAMQARHNIALYHRDHMRFNATLLYEVASDIGRESNKIKVLADYWLRPIDTTVPALRVVDPRFGGVGCPDLSPLSAVAGTGILFMEGVGEPEEIRMLKEKLKSRGEGFHNKGKWLSERMSLSWPRDRELLDPATPGAWPWVCVMAMTWQGAKQRSMAGRMLLTALEYMEQIEFTPAALRRDRTRAGKLLLAAGWSMDRAVALFTQNAASLTQDDPKMVEYLDFFEPAR